KDTPPFCYCETLQLSAYSILDEGGHTILRSSTALSSPCAEGEASFLLPLDGLEAGTYTLLIDTFICEKKADQPLPIYGDWHAAFLLE
ncbi:MAG: hypothetical protein Q4C06_07935, partial [Bacillota bacterium]|nr:hypothetical protein [Bacillota bacterium]